MNLKISPSLSEELFPGFVKKSGQKKIAILEAVIEELAAEGSGGFGFESISRRTGLVRAHVKYHFKTREDLIEGALSLITFTAQKATVEGVKGAHKPQELLIGAVQGAFRWAEQNPFQLRALCALFPYFVSKPNLRALYSNIRQKGTQRFIHAIQFGLSPKGPIPTHAELESRAILIQALINGALFSTIVLDHPPTILDIEARTIQSALGIAGLDEEPTQ